MTTPFTWSARLLDAQGKAVSAATLSVEIFNIASGRWQAVSTAKTSANGTARGSGTIADPTLPFAPALRVMDGDAVMSTSPAVAKASQGFSMDFGELRRAAEPLSFTRTGTGTSIPPIILGGGTRLGDTIDPAVVRAEVSREFADRLALRERELADSVQLVVQKDGEIQRLSGLVAARDKELADRLSASQRELAARDSLLGQNQAMLAENKRVIDLKDAEIRRLTADIVEKERLIAEARLPRPELAGAASVTRVNDLASTIGAQLDEAQTTLKARGFSLGFIEVNAKALLQDEGRRIELPDRETLKTLPPGALADVRLSFQPDKAQPEVKGQTVPDLLLLTENRARSVLASLGLLLDASTGPGALNAAAAPGQAMLQTPAPGAVLPRGGRVRVIFAGPREDQDGQ